MGEDVPPFQFAALGIDSCDENGGAAGTGNYGNVGLDNEGDGLREPDDPDCAAPPMNQAPVAVDDVASTPVNTPVDIDVLANDTDADGDTLAVNAFDGASVNAGIVSCTLLQCNYDPALNFCGADSFTYDATDSISIDPSNRATVTIQVGDANAPLVTAPADLTIILPAGSTGPVPATDPQIAAFLASATAVDPEEGSVPVSNNAPADFPIGTTPVTFTATDSCGNTGAAAANVIILVADNNVPVVTAPAPLAVTAPLCATSVPQSDPAIQNWLNSASADDVEDGTLPVSNNAPLNFLLGDTLVTFSATDSLGAIGTADSTLTVNETPNTAPVVTAPAPDTIMVPQGTTSVPATDAAIVAFLAGASANDTEDGVLAVSNDAPADFPLGITTVTFSATDACGLTSTATSTVTIQEVAGNTPPQLVTPAPITVAAGLCATSVPATDAAIDAFLNGATATDAEDGDLTASITNDAPANFPAAVAPGATTTVAFSVTDSGNPSGTPITTTGTSSVTAVDPNTPPTVTAPAPISITVPAGTTSVPATDPQIAAFLASANANDAQDGPLAVGNDAPADFPLGTTTVTFSATDACGASTSASSTVTIASAVNQPPVADANGPYSAQLGDPITFDGSGSSDDGTIVAYAWDFGDGNTGTGVSPTHTYGSAGTFTVTLTVTDDGTPALMDSATATATITDVPPPDGKVTICHKGKNTLSIDAISVPDHLGHGDTLGACPDDDDDTDDTDDTDDSE
ncbi:MAG: PKD domain-containing protein [Planctomycetota bacterium]